MSRKLMIFVMFTVLLSFILALNVFATKTAKDNTWEKREYITKNSKTKLAGAERVVGYVPPSSQQALGFDNIQSSSPGMELGITTHDFQSNGRQNRMVEFRNSEMPSPNTIRNITASSLRTFS